MSLIFINGLSAKAGGGKSILTNYLRLLHTSNLTDNYIVLVPDQTTYEYFKSSKIELIHLPKILSNKFFFPLVYSFIIPKILVKKNVNVLFNLADIPIKTKIKQVFLFDWSYAVYPNSQVWNKLDFRDYISKKIKLYYFKKFSPYIYSLIAQTETMKQHLFDLYEIKNIQVVPNAVSVENLSGGIDIDFKFPSGIKLLYLTHYYAHKNIEIFIELGKIIKAQNLNYKLITTLNSDQHEKANKFLNDIEKYGLSGIIINVGAVKMEHVPSLYKQCDGLLMPTLLESFSGTYVEAMFHKKPIFTSNFDFTIDVCRNAAVYFNPLDAQNILNSIMDVFNSKEKRERLISEGEIILNQLPNWTKTFAMYNKIINNLV